jgi:hypothetical protein
MFYCHPGCVSSVDSRGKMIQTWAHVHVSITTRDIKTEGVVVCLCKHDYSWLSLPGSYYNLRAENEPSMSSVQRPK